MKDFPEVEAVLRMSGTYMPVLKSGEEILEAENLYYSSANYFSIFSFKLLQGEKSRVLEDPYSIVISESKARMIFGDNDPIGKTVMLNNKYLLTVSGIMEDPWCLFSRPAYNAAETVCLPYPDFFINSPSDGIFYRWQVS
ncbi:MAG TPA: hypothetical protein ENH59_11555 [Bacteroidetes bacterium]|nr:hypothetical protein [Bacteroidota bacterium]